MSSAAGLGYAMVQAFGQRAMLLRIPSLPEAMAPPLLEVGQKTPTIEAKGWVNSPPPRLKDKSVRVIVIDVWGDW